ncbi:hypothetical protein J6590_037311 [Homalodisca vitripennis]|nr:hypothetical protein J6590_037311 [Homalodisca vitripennis]
MTVADWRFQTNTACSTQGNLSHPYDIEIAWPIVTVLSLHNRFFMPKLAGFASWTMYAALAIAIIFCNWIKNNAHICPITDQTPWGPFGGRSTRIDALVLFHTIRRAPCGAELEASLMRRWAMGVDESFHTTSGARRTAQTPRGAQIPAGLPYAGHAASTPDYSAKGYCIILGVSHGPARAARPNL